MDLFLQTIGAINDETRIKILRFIDTHGTVCVCDIENAFEMIQSRVSRHLKILKEAGFLKVVRKGRWAHYSIRSPLDTFRQHILKEISYLELDIPPLKTCSSPEQRDYPAKKVLIMCTGNSCRSIIAEALINKALDGVEASSCGVAPSGRVNPHAQKVLQAHGAWEARYHSKHLDDLIDQHFDLVVTVCDHARETCPIFPRPVPKIHVGFEDPDGKAYEAFEETYQQIRTILIPAVQKALR